jgi:hypothetical protein
MDLETQIFEAMELVLNSGSVTMDDLARLLAGTMEPESVPEKLPVPAIITPTEKLALKKLPEAFGSVVPLERRRLTFFELTEIYGERQLLDTVETMVNRRKANLKLTVVNHFDVTLEKNDAVGPETLRQNEGHYLIPSSEPIPETHQKFTWEISEGAPQISPMELQKMAEDPECELISHDEWLSMTVIPTPRRVFSEEKAMKALRANPKLMEAMAKATIPGRKIGSFHIRSNV